MNGGESQVPPATNAADASAWLAKGYYKNWHCEEAPAEKTGGEDGGRTRGSAARRITGVELTLRCRAVPYTAIEITVVPASMRTPMSGR